jgi:hypothetical protein
MMALNPINLGSSPNDGKGDNLRTAGDKINAVIDWANNLALPTGVEGPGILSFASVAEVLSNSTLRYGTQSNQVVAGNIIVGRQEDVRYRVAASGAPDHHVTTAGGVKLYVLPTQEGHLPAVGFGWLANNNQSAAAGNYTALDKAMLAGSAQGRFVAIPPGVAFVNRGWKYERDNYRRTGVIGLGARGACIIRFTNTLSTGGDSTWMFQLHTDNSHPFNFTLINVLLDGNHRANGQGTAGIRMAAGMAEHVLLDRLDTYNTGQAGRQLMGGLTEGAVTDRNGRSWACGMHGFATRGNLANFGTAVVFENPTAWNNDAYNMDVSSGRAIFRGSVDLRENVRADSGSLKMSVESASLIADTIVSHSSAGVGFRTTGDPAATLKINRWEIYKSADIGMRTKGLKQVSIGTLVLNSNQNRDILSEAEWVEIDVLDISDATAGDAGSTGEAIRFEGPLRYLRIGCLIARNNLGRVLAVAPSSATPTPATIVEIGHMQLHNNNRGNSSDHRIIEVRSSSHPVHMRIRDGIAYDDRATPRQTQIFSAIATNGNAARIDIDRFVFGAGAQSASRFRTSGTGAAITIGQSIGV